MRFSGDFAPKLRREFVHPVAMLGLAGMRRRRRCPGADGPAMAPDRWRLRPACQPGPFHRSTALYAALAVSAASVPSVLAAALGTITDPALAASCSALADRCAYRMVTFGSLWPRICWTS